MDIYPWIGAVQFEDGLNVQRNVKVGSGHVLVCWELM